MYKYIVFIWVFFSSFTVFSQDKSKIHLVETDSTWRKETLFFPFPFAQDIPLTGEIDVRFTHGWAKQESPYFWSYAFAWNVDQNDYISSTDLEAYLVTYLGGLMNVVNRDKDFKVPETIAVMVPYETMGDKTKYKGKIRVYDAFFSKEVILLHVEGETEKCASGNGTQLFFKLSTQTSDHEVWDHLRTAHLVDGLCEK